MLTLYPTHTLASDSGGTTLDFDATDDYVDLGIISELNDQTAFTIEMWVRPRSMYDYNMMIGRNAGVCFGRIGLFFGAASEIYFAVEDQACGIGVTAANTVQAADWYHIAGVFDGTQTGDAGRMQLYLNGQPETLSFIGTIPAKTEGSTEPVLLALQSGITNYFGDLEMDEVRIWSVARTEAEIQANMYATDLSGTEPGLVAYYKCNDGAGSTATDETGSYPGTLTNMDPATDWVTATTPVGDAVATAQTDTTALWANQASAVSGGLTLVDSSFLLDLGDDIIFGHNNGVDASNEDMPTDGDWATAAEPSRLARIWYLDKSDLGTSGGNISLTFDISESGVGQVTPIGLPSDYRLLYRVGTSGQFTDVATATTIVGDQITFADFATTDAGIEGRAPELLANGYYTLGTLDNSASPTAISMASQLQINPTAPMQTLLFLASVFLLGTATARILRRQSGSKRNR